MLCEKQMAKMVDIHTVEPMALDEKLVDELARPLVDILQDFYRDPDNERAFREWQRAKKEKSKEVTA